MREPRGSISRVPFSQKDTQYLLDVLSGRQRPKAGVSERGLYVIKAWAREILKERGVLG